MEKLLSETELLELRALRETGVPKPEWASWGDWTGPKKLNDKHKFIAWMIAHGLSQKQIREKTGFSSSRLSVLLTNSLLRVEIERCWADVWRQKMEAVLKERAEVSAITVTTDDANSRQSIQDTEKSV